MGVGEGGGGYVWWECDTKDGLGIQEPLCMEWNQLS